MLLILYLWIISSVKVDGYFHIPEGVHSIIEVIFFISTVQIRASLSASDMTLFSKIFVSRKEAAGELVSPS